MSRDPVEIRAVDSSGPDATWCIGQFFAHIDLLFDDGFTPVDDSADERAELGPPEGIFLVAYDAEGPVGCGGLKTLAPRVGEIKRMWVHERARGRGLGRRILEALEQHARDLGHTELCLDTDDKLTAAMQLYESAGYAKVERYNTNPYAKVWFRRILN